jgi:hypothetical protein
MSLEQLRASRTGRRAGLAVLRMLGALTVLVLLALSAAPTLAAAPSVAGRDLAGRHLAGRDLVGRELVGRDLAVRDLAASGGWSGGYADEDGACEQLEPQELLECGGQYDDMLDQPLVLSLLRALGVRLTADACDELLADLWAQQICEAGSLECGKMNAGAPPAPPIKLVSSSASGHSSWADRPGLDAAAKRLAFADPARAFDSRDLQPPVPPPR